MASEKGSMTEEMEGSHHEGVDLEAVKADMQNVMKSYIDAQIAANDGVFELKDEKTGNVRKLTFIRLHEKVGMAGMYHFSCADFKDVDTGEILDVDIYIDVTDGGLEVKKAVIHEVDGEPQDTSMKGSDKGSMKGSDSAY